MYSEEQQKIWTIFESACRKLDTEMIRVSFELAIGIEGTDDPMESEFLDEMNNFRVSVFESIFQKEIKKLLKYPIEDFSSVKKAFSKSIKNLKEAHEELLLDNYPYS